MLVDPDFLSLVDHLFCELADEDFTSLLPELRLAFSYFRPIETDRIAKKAAGFQGGSRKSMNSPVISPEAYSAAEELDAWVASRLNQISNGEDEEDDI